MFNLFGPDNSFNDVRATIERNRALFDNIKDPTYSNLNPELFNYDTANYELVNENPLVKSAQMSALAKLAGLADSGLSDADQASFAEAQRQGNQLKKAGTLAAISNAQSRGVGGSGLEFAMREMNNQDSADRAQKAGLETASNAAKQRALYNQAYADNLSKQRQQDYQTEAQNKSIINQFNQYNSQNRNAINQANVNARNNAFMYNEGLKDKTFQNQMNRANSMAGINNQLADVTLKENARRNAQRGAMFGLIGAGVGAAYGGPAGAGAGYGIGNGVGSLY